VLHPSSRPPANLITRAARSRAPTAACACPRRRSPLRRARRLGAPLASQRIQPVWIEVENRDDRPYFLLSPGLDPNFYPASEAAEAMGATQAHELERRFRGLAFHNPVPPGATVSGSY
jgi:hypothetical protein